MYIDNGNIEEEDLWQDDTNLLEKVQINIFLNVFL